MSAKRKEVYLRKHGLTPRSPRSSSEDLSGELSGELSGGSSSSAVPSRSPSTLRPPSAGQQQSWASKRKEHLLHRAGVARVPAAPMDVAATAVHFAAKLRLQAARAKGVKSWQEKRKEAFMATHGVRPEQKMRVAVKSVIFANRMLTKQRRASADADADASTHGVDPLERGPPSSSTSSATGGETTGVETPRGGSKLPAEKSWTQRRKETYLKRYGYKRPVDPPPTDTAVTAVAIAAMLKVRAQTVKARVAAEKASGASRADESDSAAAGPLDIS